MGVRGIRGATTVSANTQAAIYDGTAELLRTLVHLNRLAAEDVAYVWFTVTPDLDADFPANAAREALGWKDVPLICGREIPVPGALGLCVRVMLAWNTEKRQSEIRHAFLHGAKALRPGWAADPVD